MLQCFVTRYDTDNFYANIKTFGDVHIKVDIIVCYMLKKYSFGDPIIDILHFIM